MIFIPNSVKSHTIAGFYQRYLSPKAMMGIGLRTYFQSRTFFFEPQYSEPITYMTVDSKLNSGYSNELQFQLNVNGEALQMFSLNERSEFNFSFNFYHRHTDSRDWYSRLEELYAYYINFGLRYRF